ncbi:hypothetical protein PQC06_gp199 [Aeromonas phage LAh10]|uniref:Uncharacterized protein n=1 Tax=Aeromonas phage LAh10 TaxID=2591025 RepID=A0A514A1B2_9CAUD|nr:hypothetical protein PQC06_gp199 [Aeromonas phage LAh10]QDH47022.1 hypothetical protein LAh10_198 [Aeromonas phage LAh10]
MNQQVRDILIQMVANKYHATMKEYRFFQMGDMTNTLAAMIDGLQFPQTAYLKELKDIPGKINRELSKVNAVHPQYVPDYSRIYDLLCELVNAEDWDGVGRIHRGFVGHKDKITVLHHIYENSNIYTDPQHFAPINICASFNKGEQKKILIQTGMDESGVESVATMHPTSAARLIKKHFELWWVNKEKAAQEASKKKEEEMHYPPFDTKTVGDYTIANGIDPVITQMSLQELETHLNNINEAGFTRAQIDTLVKNINMPISGSVDERFVDWLDDDYEAIRSMIAMFACKNVWIAPEVAYVKSGVHRQAARSLFIEKAMNELIRRSVITGSSRDITLDKLESFIENHPVERCYDNAVYPTKTGTVTIFNDAGWDLDTLSLVVSEINLSPGMDMNPAFGEMLAPNKAAMIAAISLFADFKYWSHVTTDSVVEGTEEIYQFLLKRHSGVTEEEPQQNKEETMKQTTSISELVSKVILGFTDLVMIADTEKVIEEINRQATPTLAGVMKNILQSVKPTTPPQPRGQTESFQHLDCPGYTPRSTIRGEYAEVIKFINMGDVDSAETAIKGIVNKYSVMELHGMLIGNTPRSLNPNEMANEIIEVIRAAAMKRKVDLAEIARQSPVTRLIEKNLFAKAAQSSLEETYAMLDSYVKQVSIIQVYVALFGTTNVAGKSFSQMDAEIRNSLTTTNESSNETGLSNFVERVRGAVQAMDLDKAMSLLDEGFSMFGTVLVSTALLGDKSAIGNRTSRELVFMCRDAITTWINTNKSVARHGTFSNPESRVSEEDQWIKDLSKLGFKCVILHK